MAAQNEEERRVAALCRSLGNLWSEEDVVEIKGDITDERLSECRKTLFGKFYTNSNANFTAFLNTMKRVWRVDTVTCTVLEPGYYSFSFQSEAEKQRVFDMRPWSFSSHLLVLQQCDPDTPELCYDFTHCEFWVQFYGLPYGRVTYDVIRDIAVKLGEVIEVKIETKGNSNYKFGKARIKLDLEKPLKTGVLVNLEKKRLWIEFKYERLPHYCYSCGKIGHYATFCREIPYEKSGLADNLPGRFGQWLKAEVRQLSPYGKIFYGKQEIIPEDVESVPETPIYANPETGKNQQEQNSEQDLAICGQDDAEQHFNQENRH